MREIVLDTETTGLEPLDGHRIVEIGCIELVDRYPTGRTFHVYLNPDRDMPFEAFQVHGLSREFLIDKPRFADVHLEFLAFIEDAKLVIHNAAFDTKFINHELDRVGQRPLMHDRIVDSLQLARRKHPNVANSLDALCDRYGLDRGRRLKHGALLDAEILAEVYSELLGGKQSTFDLSLRAGSHGEGAAQPVRLRRIALRPRLSDEERRAHAAFVATLGSAPLWSLYARSEAQELSV